MTRLRELDFLRGTALVLVLLRHIPLFSFTTNMGWIGVDLFFVLSGFLVSGLLFKEYLKFNFIRPKYFLIRRGFKIYPIYYIFYIPYLLMIFRAGTFNLKGFLADMTFTQNYLWSSGYAYAYGSTWSLAVEEHFYFTLTFFLWLLIKYKPNIFYTNKFPKSIILILIFCLLLRIVSNTLHSTPSIKLFSLTHFRIDSLLMGVLISYFYYFRFDYLNRLFHKYKYFLLPISFVGLTWTPFIDPNPSFFVKTFGFSILYISFGALLIVFLLTNKINIYLNKIFSSLVVNIISKLGFCSFSIYIIHTFVISILSIVLAKLHFSPNNYLFFILACTVSVIVGMLITYNIEKYFLIIRDKYYPSRA